MTQAPTFVFWNTTAKSISVSHSNRIVRYFNGVKYTTIQSRTSFHVPAQSRLAELNWTTVSHYTQVSSGLTISFRQNKMNFVPQIHDEIRAVLIMVPDDMQSVPF